MLAALEGVAPLDSFAAAQVRSRVLARLAPDDVVQVARLLTLTGGRDSALKLIAALVCADLAYPVRYQPGCVVGPTLVPLGIDVDAPIGHQRQLLDQLLPSTSPTLPSSGTLRGHLASLFDVPDPQSPARASARAVLESGVDLASAVRSVGAAVALQAAELRECEFSWLTAAIDLTAAVSPDGPLSRLWRRALSVPNISPSARFDRAAAEFVLLRLPATRSDDDVVEVFARAMPR